MLVTTGRPLHLIQTNRYHFSGSWIDVALCMKLDASRGTRKLEAVVSKTIRSNSEELHHHSQKLRENPYYFKQRSSKGRRYCDLWRLW